MRQRLGCLTPAGLLAALITALVIAGAWVIQGGQMFSPGALNAKSGQVIGGVSSHAEIAAECGACHAPFWQQGGGMSARCLDCHTAVASEISGLSGLHGHLAEDRPVLDCRECHTEHHGEQAALTLVDAEFPHQRTGFALTAHQAMADGTPFACRDCHVDSYAAMPVGLCADCHADLDAGYVDDHLGVFGPNCLECHDGVDRFGADFDHSLTDFALTGAHAPIDCAGCHQGMTTLAALQSTPVECVSCHLEDDEHEGTLGTDCAACHSPEGWEPATFDHDQSGFPLVGEHREAECAECHADAVFSNTPSDCIACHREDDEHEGTLGSDCAACHSPEGWEPAEFDHDKSGFPLTGAHIGPQCEDCHVGAVFAETPTECLACHRENDVHQATLGADCAICHTTQAWKPASYDHNQSSFPLTGAHVNAACTACHSTPVFQNTPSDCVACHAQDDAHNTTLGTDCGTCHATSAWKPATFDHNRSGFPLVGAHVAVACAGCHAGSSFQNTPAQCAACHSQDDAHNGSLGSDCGACHSANGWTPASFDHNLSSFPLTGAHNSVPCASCHANASFQNTPTQCVACHAEPSEHFGQFGTDCAVCHTTSAWEPAGYNGPHTFPMDHGDANGCRDCHPSTLTQWTCYTCHDQGEVDREHRDEGIANFSNCMECHANGDEHGGRDGGGEGDDD